MPNALPVVYEFDSNMKHVNNYCLMDIESHSIKAERRELSYNNIDWTMIRSDEYTDGIHKSELSNLGTKF